MERVTSIHRIKANKTHACDYCGKIIHENEYTEEAVIQLGLISFNAYICDRCHAYVDEALASREWDGGMDDAKFMEYMQEEHEDIAKEWWNEET